jgi:hypothetical protein
MSKKEMKNVLKLPVRHTHTPSQIDDLKKVNATCVCVCVYIMLRNNKVFIEYQMLCSEEHVHTYSL